MNLKKVKTPLSGCHKVAVISNNACICSLCCFGQNSAKILAETQAILPANSPFGRTRQYLPLCLFELIFYQTCQSIEGESVSYRSVNSVSWKWARLVLISWESSDGENYAQKWYLFLILYLTCKMEFL